MTKLEKYEALKKEVCEFLKNSVDWLIYNDCGCCTYKLDEDFGICVGWSSGFAPADDAIYHSEDDPEYAIVAGVKLYNSDAMRTDYDFIDFAVDNEGNVWDIECPLSPYEDESGLSEWLLTSYYSMINNYDLDNGVLIERDFESIA